MNRSTHVIKDTATEQGANIKVWRETQYKGNGLETTFFVDLRTDQGLVMRQPYGSLNEALDHYYGLVSSALKYGEELHRVRV